MVSQKSTQESKNLSSSLQPTTIMLATTFIHCHDSSVRLRSTSVLDKAIDALDDDDDEDIYDNMDDNSADDDDRSIASCDETVKVSNLVESEKNEDGMYWILSMVSENLSCFDPLSIQ